MRGGIAALAALQEKRPRKRSFLSFVGAAEEVVDGGSVELGQLN